MKKAKKAPAKKAARRGRRIAMTAIASVSSVELFKNAHDSKTIQASTIYDLWVAVLGRRIKDLNDPPSDYGIADIIGYADFLNKTPEFKKYGLDLQQSDVVNVNTMGDLGGAIVGNFQSNGWTVTPD